MGGDELKQLQEELLQLKQLVPGLQLRKSTAAQSPAAPFPIIARAEVVAPPAAERYDVQTFTLACRLGSGVAAPGVAGGVLEAAVQVTVESPDLPAVLRQAMGAELHRLWAAAGPVAGRLNLQLLWGTAPQQFVHLLSLVPAVLESYQSEDAWGGTVRRWAILSDAASMQFDAPAQQQQQQGGQAAAAEAAPAPAAVPKGLQSELDFLRKLYDLQLHQQHEAAAGEAAAADAVAERLTGLHLAPSAAGRVGAAATEAVLAFELSLRPRDPAWDPARPALVLHGWVQPGAYPAAGSLAVEASAAQRPLLPTLQLEVLNKLLAHEVAAAAGRPGALRAVARHADNHGGQLLAQAEDIASEVARRRRQLQEEQRGGTAAAAAAEGAQRGSSASELDGSGSSDGGYSSGGSYSSGSAESGSAASSGQEDASGQRHGGGGHSDAVLPLQLQLERLELVDCDVLELLRLNIQVSCARCRATGELSFATAAVALPSDGGGGCDGGSGGTLAAAADCPTCHQAWEVQVAPKLVHERSNVLSLLRSTGCAPIDLLPSMLAGQCGRCASSAAFRSVAVGRWNERACSACHTPMRFQFSTALFAPHRAPAGRQPGAAGGGQPVLSPRSRPASSAAAGAGGEYQGLLQLGQPLPNRGTCQHYHHSYRWLRFPCCGKRFPCDLCHEEGTDGHEMRWATRMVCGYCSLEQALGPLCKSCGKKLATSAATPSGRHTKFWEGGKGQRDPRRLHKGDPRRYRGKGKTSSRKSTRVGDKGKERREQREGAG